jgi:hypothetical protein
MPKPEDVRVTAAQHKHRYLLKQSVLLVIRDWDRDDIADLMYEMQKVYDEKYVDHTRKEWLRRNQPDEKEEQTPDS